MSEGCPFNDPEYEGPEVGEDEPCPTCGSIKPNDAAPCVWQGSDADGADLAALQSDLAAATARAEKAERHAKLLDELVEEGRRAIGDHWAPNDCYATGPVTGDVLRDLIQCPACSFIDMYDRAKAKPERAADFFQHRLNASEHPDLDAAAPDPKEG